MRIWDLWEGVAEHTGKPQSSTRGAQTRHSPELANPHLLQPCQARGAMPRGSPGWHEATLELRGGL